MICYGRVKPHGAELQNFTALPGSGTQTRRRVHAWLTQREVFIDNLLVRTDFVIEMIWWTGLAPEKFEFSFSGSVIFTFLLRYMPN